MDFGGACLASGFALFPYAPAATQVVFSERIAFPATALASFGHAVCALGDVDGDGVGDVAIGNPWDSSNGVRHGAVWIAFLRADGSTKAMRDRHPRRVVSASTPATGGADAIDLPVPPDLALLGLRLRAQGLIGGGGPELCNALDVVLGN